MPPRKHMRMTEKIKHADMKSQRTLLSYFDRIHSVESDVPSKDQDIDDVEYIGIATRNSSVSKNAVAEIWINEDDCFPEVIQSENDGTCDFNSATNDDDIIRSNCNRKSESKNSDNYKFSEKSVLKPKRDSKTDDSIHRDDQINSFAEYTTRFGDENVNSVEICETNPRTDPESSPYYFHNFCFVLESVLSNENDKKLFDLEDLEVIERFYKMHDSSKKLYVRLFQRKQKWNRLQKILYPNISDDIVSVLDDLASNSFLDTAEKIDEVETTLNLMSLKELKTFANDCNIITKGINKKQIIDVICQHGRKQKSLFGGSVDIQQTLLKKAKRRIGKCYKVSTAPREIFMRIFVLFSLIVDDDDEINLAQKPLLQILMVNIGKTVFPDYKIQIEEEIFQTRDELISYVDALHLETDMLTKIEKKDWTSALHYLNEVLTRFKLYETKSVIEKKSFLLRFSAGHVYCRCLTHGIDVLQRMKDYKSAIKILHRLIDQQNYCGAYKGRWYDRLALNLDQHMKLTEKAIDVIREGLDDANLRLHHKLSLSIRAQKIGNSSGVKNKKDLLEQLENLNPVKVRQIPTVTIQGTLLPRSIPGRKTVFIRSDERHQQTGDGVVLCSVEEVALTHYKQNGYREGIHGEASTFVTLYSLLFWDIIYDDDIPDVFRVPHQAYPLDLNSDCFYRSRKEAIDSRLDWLTQASIQQLSEEMRKNWIKFENQVSLVRWDRFTDIDQAVSLLRCFNGRSLSKIFEMFAKDYRHYRSGLPDLIVWCPETTNLKVVEVKGPGDRLSTKQMIWLDKLIDAGISAEVCYVEAIGSKKLKKITDE